MASSTRVFLCDDNPELRELTRCGLEADAALKVVGEAGDALTALAVVPKLRPDVLLLDLSMPGMDGLEAIPKLREKVPQVAIVVFSAFSAERLGEESLRRGADRYVEKGTSMDAIRRTVRELHAGRVNGAGW